MPICSYRHIGMNGSPEVPFLGHISRSKAQTEQLKRVWDSKDISRLDYVTAWHAKALSFLSNRRGLLAFITTNSIVQGDQIPLLFRRIFEEGRRIRFAHRTFAWDSEAPRKAAVHCVIIGFDRRTEPKSRLWDHPNINDEPITTPVERC
nr:DNA methyltransferase [Corynebacterium stationis]